MLVLQGWHQGWFPCRDAHCMHGCPIGRDGGDEQGEDRDLPCPVCHGRGGGDQMLNCSLSSLLKHFSLTGLVLCFCTSPLSE